MSIFNRLSAQCPHCGAVQTIELVASVNADRRPDLREQILARAFQARPCTSCGSAFRFPPRFTYQHFDMQQWILVHPRPEVAKWRALDDEALEIFAANYGPGTSPMAEEIGREVSPRVVFGWPALREKLVARAAGLDDITLELLKMAVIRDIPGSPLTDETELRLERAEANILVLAWTEGQTEAVSKALHVPRGAYDEVAADTGDWAEPRAQFTGHAFVDLNRLLVPAGAS
jgi:hypothetical protein